MSHKKNQKKSKKIFTRFLENIVGGRGNGTKKDEIPNEEVIAGTDLDDNMQGTEGDETMLGGKGDDYIAFGSGNDVVHGGEGNDTIDDVKGRILEGENELHGGAGNDTIWAGHGDDLVTGGTGNDLLLGETGNDTILGGQGDDNIIGGQGDDYIHGDAVSELEEMPRENLLQNGSFNSENDHRSMVENNGKWSKPLAPEGWEITKGSGVEIKNGDLLAHGLAPNPNDNGNYIELDGINSSGIAQSIETVAGQNYELSFDFGTRAAHGGDNQMEVLWEGEVIDTIEKQAHGSVEWTTHSYNLTAGDPKELKELSGKLEFRSIGDNDKGGELLDNVSLSLSEGNLVEGQGNDRLSGGAGNDILIGGAGDDVLWGDDKTQYKIIEHTARIDVNNFNSIDQGFKVSGKNIDGITSTQNVIVSGGSLGIAGAAVGNVAPNQIGHNPVTGKSEALIVNFDNPVSKLSFEISRAFQGEGNNRGDAKGDEQGIYKLYQDDELVGEGKFTASSGHSSSIEVSPSDKKDFNKIVFEATEYSGGDGTQTMDSSDYLVDSIDFSYTEKVIVGAGDDILEGGTGKDKLFGGAGTDTIKGGTGNDWINGGQGADQLDGGEGKDTAAYYSSNSGVEVNLESGIGKGGEAEGDKLKDVENLRGSKYDDTLIGDDGDNRITGESGDDQLIGGYGDDTLLGGAGNDVLKGDGVAENVLTLKVENLGKASAGYHNSYGYYVTDDEGNPSTGQIIWADVKDSVGQTFELENVNKEKIGFFLIPNGDNANKGLSDGQEITFQQDDKGSWSPFLDGEKLRGQGGATLYSNTELNEGDYKYSNDSKAVGNQNWEDLVGGGDRDNNDVNMNVSWLELEAKDEGGNDVLFSGQGDDIVEGGAGDDWLNGGAGADQLDGGAGTDMTAYLNSNEAVDVNLSKGVGKGGFAEGDTFKDIENVRGSNFDDKITGSDEDNRLLGEAGDDTIHAGKGDDFVSGGKGSDRISGGLGNDRLDGGEGNDVLFSGQGDDIVEGGAGDDWLNGGAGADQLDGGAGTDMTAYLNSNEAVDVNLSKGVGKGGFAEGDTFKDIENVRGSNFDDKITGSDEDNRLLGEAGDDTIHAGKGDDFVSGGKGSDRITGGLGNDRLDGGEGNDVLFSGQGDDIVEGGAGDDWLNGGAGADQLDGGAGTDMTAYLNSNEAVDVNLSKGVGKGGFAEGDTFKDIENVRGSNFDDKITGSDEDNRLLGEAGDDTIHAGKGDDFVSGGKGSDRITGGLGNDRLDGGEGNDVLKGGKGSDLLSGDEGDDHIIGGQGNDTINGGEGNDILRGNQGKDTLLGGQGDDWLNGGAGGDVLEGGEGNDVAAYLLSEEGVEINLEKGTGKGGWAEGDKLSDVEGVRGSTHDDVITGSDAGNWVVAEGGKDEVRTGKGDDYVDGGQGDDVIHTGAGNDRALGGAGDDKLFGGRGSDELEGGEGDDVLKGGQGADVLGGGAGDDKLFGGRGSDELEGGGGDDVLKGGHGADVLGGGAGDDKLFGGRGSDELEGGEGDDVLKGGHGADVLGGGAGDDKLFGGRGSDELEGGGGDDVLKGGHGADVLGGGAGDDKLFGGRGSDELEGGEGDDLLKGGHGADVLGGGAGDDKLFGGRGSDELEGGEGDDVLKGGHGADVLGGGAGDDKLFGGRGSDELEGGGGDDVLKGGHGADVLGGGAGDDKLFGGRGSDVLEGGGGDDVLKGGHGADVLGGGAGDDKLFGGRGSDELEGGEGDDVLKGGHGADVLGGGAGDDKLFGGRGSDVLEGGEGDDVLKGGHGADVLGGGAGDDKLFGGRGSDVLEGGEGDDALSGGKGSDVLKGDMGDDKLLGGGGADVLHGGIGTDVLKGGTGDDRLFGDQGADVLEGGTGDDVLRGGTGNDLLKGGAGEDTFIFSKGDGKDLVDGGEGQDTIHLSDITQEEFIEAWEIKDGRGQPVDVVEFITDGAIDLSAMNGVGKMIGPDGDEISFKSLESITFAEEGDDNERRAGVVEDGLSHDGKITLTLGGEAFKGDPEYAVIVDGEEVARGEVDWSKDTTGEAALYGNEGNWDLDNTEVKWKDISLEYDFSNGMPKQIEVKFLNDAYGGKGTDDDRNLIVDKIKVDGLVIESEGDFTKYPQSEGKYGLDGGGMERMPWQGSLEFNIEDAYASHLHNLNNEIEAYQAPIGENLVLNSSFEEHGILNHGSWGTFDKIPGWQASTGVIEIQSKQHGGTAGAEDGKAFLELDAHGNSSVYQDILTGNEGSFRLSFSFSAREGGQGGSDVAKNNLTEVYWGGQKIATITADQKGWESFEYELSAENNEEDFTRLEFRAVGTEDSIGGLIDNISLIRVK